MADEERKIIIDEDWKSQVEKEKEQAGVEAPSDEAEEAVHEIAGHEDEEHGPGQLPEASFMNLVGSLAAQSMVALGAVQQPGQQQIMVDLGQAKYCIDTLAMLKEKTEGNLSEDEDTELTQVLAQLQQIFVTRAHQVQEQEMRQAGIDPQNLTGGD